MADGDGATPTGVPAGGEEKDVQPTARELAMDAIEARRLEQFEKESGVTFEKSPVTADPDDDNGDAVAEAARKELADKAAAADALDPTKQVAAQGGDDLILDADTIAKAKVRIKVDGVEELVPASKAFAQYQKGGAADVRLADATRLQREAAEDRAKAKEQLEAATRTPVAAPAAAAKPVPSEKFKQAGEALFGNDVDGFATAVAEAVQATMDATKVSAAPAATPVDTQSVVREVKQQLSQESALTKLFQDYPEIKDDSDLSLLADRYVAANVTLGKSVSDAIALAGEQLGEKFKLGHFKEPLGRPIVKSDAPTTREQKLAGKQRLDEPTASAARAAEPEMREESASDVIAQLKKDREREPLPPRTAI